MTLPSELIELIISFVEEESFLPCLLINSCICKIIRDSPLLNYRWTLFRARMRDNPLVRLPLFKKMNRLLSTEKAWLSCDPEFETSTEMPFNIECEHYVSDGVLFVLDEHAEDGEGCICYIELPAGPDDAVPEWKRMRGTEDIDNLAIGLCIAEHDLVVLVDREKEDESQPGYDVVISLVQYSTGDAHPLAQESKIVAVSGRTSGAPTIDVEISGDHMVLVMATADHRAEEPDDLVLIYDWRKGILKATIVGAYHQYMNVVFLTETLILLPMLHIHSLAIYRIPSEACRDRISPIVLLQLPLLSNNDEAYYRSISTKSRPNFFAAQPRAHGGVPAVPLQNPSLPRAEDAICAFEITIAYFEDEMGDLEPSCFTMIVHRRSFVELAEVFDEYLSFDPIFDRTKPRPILWEHWGPPISRWLQSSAEINWLASRSSVSKCSGQRYVRKMEKEDGNTGFPYVVLDFNLNNMNNGISARDKSAEWDDVPLIRYHINTSITRIGPHDLFKGPVQGSLPYTAGISSHSCHSDNILLDSEHVLGLYV
ncbi:hypothetical protein CPC08DRAFT_663765, partial [Agrocybe pediades]